MNFEELYQDIVLDHSRRPRHFGPLEAATHHAEGDNPSCGDEIAVHLEIDNGQIRAASFTGCGCSICLASASLMTLKLQDCSVDSALQRFEHFHSMLTSDCTPDPSLGDLAVFQIVRRFPQRVKCATLPWQTLRKALP